MAGNSTKGLRVSRFIAGSPGGEIGYKPLFYWDVSVNSGQISSMILELTNEQISNIAVFQTLQAAPEGLQTHLAIPESQLTALLIYSNIHYDICEACSGGRDLQVVLIGVEASTFTSLSDMYVETLVCSHCEEVWSSLPGQDTEDQPKFRVYRQ